MILEDDYVLAEANLGTKKWWDPEHKIYYKYYPVYDRVYVEDGRETFWIKADCLNEGIEKHMTSHVIYNKRELKVM